MLRNLMKFMKKNIADNNINKIDLIRYSRLWMNMV